MQWRIDHGVDLSVKSGRKNVGFPPPRRDKCGNCVEKKREFKKCSFTEK